MRREPLFFARGARELNFNVPSPPTEFFDHIEALRESERREAELASHHLNSQIGRNLALTRQADAQAALLDRTDPNLHGGRGSEPQSPVMKALLDNHKELTDTLSRMRSGKEQFSPQELKEVENDILRNLQLIQEVGAGGSIPADQIKSLIDKRFHRRSKDIVRAQVQDIIDESQRVGNLEDAARKAKAQGDPEMFNILQGTQQPPLPDNIVKQAGAIADSLSSLAKKGGASQTDLATQIDAELRKKLGITLRQFIQDQERRAGSK